MLHFATKLIVAGASTLCTLGLVGFSNPAAAAVPTAPQAIVHYTKAELATAAGREAIARRIGGAVSQVCDDNGPVDRIALNACRTQAFRHAHQMLAAQADNQSQIAAR
jgi:UrcA family protein